MTDYRTEQLEDYLYGLPAVIGRPVIDKPDETAFSAQEGAIWAPVVDCCAKNAERGTLITKHDNEAAHGRLDDGFETAQSNPFSYVTCEGGFEFKVCVYGAYGVRSFWVTWVEETEEPDNRPSDDAPWDSDSGEMAPY